MLQQAGSKSGQKRKAEGQSGSGCGSTTTEQAGAHGEASGEGRLPEEGHEEDAADWMME